METPFSLAIVRGHPTPEELAALTAVLLARLRGTAGQDTTDGVFDEPPARADWRAGGRRPRRRPPVAWSTI